MEYEAPTIVRSTIVSDGYGMCFIHKRILAKVVWRRAPRTRIELNVQELRPPRMDDSGRVKYPVLFRV